MKQKHFLLKKQHQIMGINSYKSLSVSILLFFCFLSQLAIAQNRNIDSLNNLLSIQEDTLKVVTLIKIGNSFKEFGDYNNELNYYFKALEFAEENGNNKSLFRSYYAISQYFMNKNNFDQALEYGLKAEKVAEQLGNKETLYNIYDLIGGYIYFNHQDYKKAFEYGHKMMGIISSKKDSIALRNMLMWFGDVYRLAKSQDSAIIAYQNALEISKQFSDTEKVAACLHGIGLAYSITNNYKEVINYYLQSINIAKKGQLSTANFTRNIAFAYFKAGQYKEALLYATNSLQSNIKEGDRHTQMDLYKLISDINLNSKKYVGAYVNICHYYELRDSLESGKSQNKINGIYKDKKKEKEIYLLQKQTQLQKTLRNVLLTGLILLIATVFLLINKYRSKKKSEAAIASKNNELIQSFEELKSTQSQLIQSEKMASLGELTAGIAHEIQNPLNFVNNFSEVSSELLDEMKTELDKGDIEEAKAIANDVKQNLEKINHHGKRADAIVKSMLQHSRSSTGKKEPTDINALCDEYLRLSYHGLRAKDKSFNATFNTDFDKSISSINIISQDIGRVILNLLTNAFYAVSQKKMLNIDGYEPTVSISTKKVKDTVEIAVSDNGNGIPQKVLDKIFQPFFTTKPTGQGTGLGLSLSYDIVKAHGGELKVETKEGEGTIFSIIVSL